MTVMEPGQSADVATYGNFTYHSNGLLDTIEEKSFGQFAVNSVWTYTVNSETGQIEKRTNGGYSFEYRYDSDGNLSERLEFSEPGTLRSQEVFNYTQSSEPVFNATLFTHEFKPMDY